MLTVVRAQLLYDAGTVHKNAEDAKSARSQLRMIQWLLPAAALVLGVVLIVVGVALAARQPAGGQREEAAEPRPADAR